MLISSHRLTDPGKKHPIDVFNASREKNMGFKLPTTFTKILSSIITVHNSNAYACVHNFLLPSLFTSLINILESWYHASELIVNDSMGELSETFQQILNYHI